MKIASNTKNAQLKRLKNDQSSSAFASMLTHFFMAITKTKQSKKFFNKTIKNTI